ncbi:MAG: hypothetical protein M3R08_07875, partial [Bacteroidota bacterium]|nr:hypothetical protein [Bacteroidota bacterium]
SRIVHPGESPTAISVSSAPGFDDIFGQRILLKKELLEIALDVGHEKLYGPRLGELFKKPDEVWQDNVEVHGSYWRYLKFHFDYLLIACVDIRDPQQPYVFLWLVLEYHAKAGSRSKGIQVKEQQRGILIHGPDVTIR